MYVVKRDGNQEEVSFDKVLKRIKSLSEELNVNPVYCTKSLFQNLRWDPYSRTG